MVHDNKINQKERIRKSLNQIYFYRLVFGVFVCLFGFFLLYLGNISLQGIQKHSRSSFFCSASSRGLACRDIRTILKGLLAQKKAREFSM